MIMMKNMMMIKNMMIIANNNIENKDDDYDAGPPPHQSVSRLSPSGGAGKNTINEQESQQAENQGTSQENFQEYFQNIPSM